MGLWIAATFGVMILLVIIILIMMKNNRFTLLKFYTTIVSLVGVIGLTVGYGVAIFNGIQHAVISDEEYMNGRGMRYQFDTCSQPKYAAVAPAEGEQPAAPTAEEIAACEDKTRTSMLAERNYNTKQTVIGGITWGTLALIMFAIHYPMLIKKSREEDND